jgi:hypothetical protein
MVRNNFNPYGQLNNTIANAVWPAMVECADWFSLS